jgi:F-type H+-transporting ATPase subunit b
LQLKRRLDYIRETDEAKRRFEREHMIKWIIDQVNKSITPDVQKSYTTKCIEELKSLSKQTAS